MSQKWFDRVRVPDSAGSGMHRAMLVKSASMYSDIQREPPDIGSILAHPDYLEGNTELIKPKKLQNPVKASRSHQELHRELLMNHRRGLGIDKKPELQRVLENRRRDKIIQQKKEEEEIKKMQSPFEQELLKRQQRLEQLEKEQEPKEETHAPEFIKVKENLRRTATLPSDERML
ncbi:actin-associated protein FAM107A isoform X2 [Hyperolius riggenbachi]|uniref:actin-associated protein FAM107A isoform X2 n=1 Tax=Hyperolius riggenbachi TaxID=752182 RepID=UPI0035A2F5AB